MANTLKKITARAKQLRKKHPHTPWKNLVKKAGRDYRAGKLGSVKKSKSRQTGSSNEKRDRERSARPPGARIPAGGKKVTYYERRKNRSDKPGSLTGATTAQLKSEIKNRLEDQLGKQLVRREMAPTKTRRRKINKQVIETRRKLKKLI